MPGLAVVAVVDDLALLLGLGDVGAGLEVEHLGAAHLGGGARGASQERRPRGGERSGLEEAASADRELPGSAMGSPPS